MRRPTDDEIARYCSDYGVTSTVAWRDYLQLRLAEATSRDPDLFELCVWKGAFFARFVLNSSRGSGDLDATVGTNKDRVDPRAIRRQLINACQDLGIEIPKPDVLEGGEKAVSFSSIIWQEAGVGAVATSIDLSMREDLIRPPRQLTIRSPLIAPFVVLHIDPNEQAAEKMRCLAERAKVGDGFDVHLLWQRRDLLDADEIRQMVPLKLTSGKDHRARAFAGIETRYGRWHPGEDELPFDAPSRDEMRDACRAAVAIWVV